MSKNISLLNEQDIQDGKLIALVPELYDLKDVIEKNEWHNNENVFDHTFSVLNYLKKIILDLGKETKQYLNEEIDNNTRKSLLMVATLFHDVGKSEVITDDGKYTPDHEEQSYKKAKKILERFDLSSKESKFILGIIKFHGLIHRMLLIDNHDLEEDVANLRKKLSDINVELILLSYADTMSSHLKETRPVEFQFRIDFYQKELKSF